MNFHNSALIGQLIAIIIGVMTSLIGTWLWSWIAPRLPIICKSPFPSISGWWVGQLKPVYDPGREVLNLIRLRCHDGKVQIYIEHYNNRRSFPLKYRGIGIYLDSSLSAIYYEVGNHQTGVWSLRLKNDVADSPIFEGLYAHVIDRDGVEGTSARSEYYRLQQVQLPMKIQFKVLLGRCCFKNYQAATEFFQEKIKNGKKLTTLN